MNNTNKTFIITICLIIFAILFLQITGLVRYLPSILTNSFSGISIIGLFTVLIAAFLGEKNGTQVALDHRKATLRSGVIWIISSIVLMLNMFWFLQFFPICSAAKAEEGFTVLFGCILGLPGALSGYISIIGLVVLAKGISIVVLYFRQKKNNA